MAKGKGGAEKPDVVELALAETMFQAEGQVASIRKSQIDTVEDNPDYAGTTLVWMKNKSLYVVKGKAATVRRKINS